MRNAVLWSHHVVLRIGTSVPVDYPRALTKQWDTELSGPLDAGR